MIYDSIQNAGLYKGISENLSQAIAYMMTTDFSSLSVGRHDIAGDKIYLMIQDPALRSFEKTAWEAHRQYIDIQFSFIPGETIAYAPHAAIENWEAYNQRADSMASRSATRGIFLPMLPGMFVVFFPHDAHRPLIGDGHMCKAVIKVLADGNE